jgi:hypothetical protein
MLLTVIVLAPAGNETAMAMREALAAAASRNIIFTLAYNFEHDTALYAACILT